VLFGQPQLGNPEEPVQQGGIARKAAGEEA
jgi:hypothetical protein